MLGWKFGCYLPMYRTNVSLWCPEKGSAGKVRSTDQSQSGCWKFGELSVMCQQAVVSALSTELLQKPLYSDVVRCVETCKWFPQTARLQIRTSTDPSLTSSISCRRYRTLALNEPLVLTRPTRTFGKGTRRLEFNYGHVLKFIRNFITYSLPFDVATVFRDVRGKNLFRNFSSTVDVRLTPEIPLASVKQSPPRLRVARRWSWKHISTFNFLPRTHLLCPAFFLLENPFTAETECEILGCVWHNFCEALFSAWWLLGQLNVLPPVSNPSCLLFLFHLIPFQKYPSLIKNRRNRTTTKTIPSPRPPRCHATHTDIHPFPSCLREPFFLIRSHTIVPLFSEPFWKGDHRRF